MSDMFNTKRLLTVTVDINNKFLFSWGNPTEDQPPTVGGVSLTNVTADRMLDGVIRIETEASHSARPGVAMEGVTDERIKDDGQGQYMILSYGGRVRQYVVMYASMIPILHQFDVVRILKPQYFHQSRTGGRICVNSNGVEYSILTMLGWYHGIADPSWTTRQCWIEHPDKVVSISEKPVAGTPAYMKEYYEKTAAARREARAAAKAAKTMKIHTQATRTETIDDIIASLKGKTPNSSGGGGPLSAPPATGLGTILGRDIPRGGSRE
jgi:hypothetical protein